MSTRAEQRPRAVRALLAATITAVLAAALLPLTAPPAAAIHQHCGDDYPAGTLASGHPDTSQDSAGWTGLHVMQPLETTLLALDGAKGILDNLGGVFVASAELVHIQYDQLLQQSNPISTGIANAIVKPVEYAVRAVAVAFYVAETALFLAETALMATQLALEEGVDDENTCGGTLQGDLVNTFWVALVQRSLATTGPPLAILVAPHDSQRPDSTREWPLMPQRTAGDFAWCPTIDLPEELPPADQAVPAGDPTTSGKDDCTPQVHVGFLDAPDIGVRDIVANTIAHAKAHGLPLRHAEEALARGETELAAGRYKQAFAEFRQAYRDAMRLTD